MSLTDFYRAFEDRHRGSRELILERVQVYLPFISPLLTIYSPAAALDLGCGRGEWLQTAGAAGFQAHGVDLDQGMLQACLELGLSVTHGDAIALLCAQPNESLCVISGFHVAEHMPFEQLNILVREALRALKPGGVLILETPNPENLVVGTANFYLDPTHQRPIPPLLLEFLPQHHGFARFTTLRLQEAQGIQSRQDIRLMDVLHGVSPDYSVVAQKSAPQEVLALLDAAFAQHRGVDLSSLANRFDQRQDELLTAHHQTRLLLASQQQQLLGIDAKLQLIQAERDAAQHASNAMRDSVSWKITAPLRATASFAASPISFTMGRILQNPRLSGRLNRILIRFPSLHARLRGTALAQGMMTEPLAAQAMLAPTTEADLSPRAREIHAALTQKSQTRGNGQAHPH